MSNFNVYHSLGYKRILNAFLLFDRGRLREVSRQTPPGPRVLTGGQSGDGAQWYRACRVQWKVSTISLKRELKPRPSDSLLFEPCCLWRSGNCFSTPELNGGCLWNAYCIRLIRSDCSGLQVSAMGLKLFLAHHLHWLTAPSEMHMIQAVLSTSAPRRPEFRKVITPEGMHSRRIAWLRVLNSEFFCFKVCALSVLYAFYAYVMLDKQLLCEKNKLWIWHEVYCRDCAVWKRSGEKYSCF